MCKIPDILSGVVGTAKILCLLFIGFKCVIYVLAYIIFNTGRKVPTIRKCKCINNYRNSEWFLECRYSVQILEDNFEDKKNLRGKF
jgi:hypothetical protein